MKLKITKNTIFHDTQGYYSSNGVSVKAFKEQALYYFSPDGLINLSEAVITVEKKNTMYWITIKHSTGSYLEKAVCHYSNKNLILYNYEPAVLFYKTIKDFAEDFKASTDNDFRILRNYKSQIKRKEESMKEMLEIKKDVEQTIPEYFL